jgi:hypothetical protein
MEEVVECSRVNVVDTDVFVLDEYLAFFGFRNWDIGLIL